MTTSEGMTAFVPSGDNRRDTAIILIAAARDNGLDDSKHVVATSGGFYISDTLADLLGADEDQTTEVDSDTEVPEEPTEVDKAANQIDAEDRVEGEAVDGDEVADAAIVEPHEAVSPIAPEPVEPEPKAKTATKKTSGNRAAKKTTSTNA